MPNYIVKLTRNGESRYMVWSTVVDAPTSALMPLEFFTRCYFVLFGFTSGAGGPSDFAARMKRVEETGCSSLDGLSAEEIIEGNRAGPNETTLTAEEIWDAYSHPA